jgi:UrcA family protein
MMFRAFAAVSILALTVTTTQAADSAIAVKFSDLDLSKPSDVRTLQARVQEAANKACGQLQLSYPSPPTLFYKNWFKDCVGAASAETTRRVEARAGQYRAFASN